MSLQDWCITLLIIGELPLTEEHWHGNLANAGTAYGLLLGLVIWVLARKCGADKQTIIVAVFSCVVSAIINRVSGVCASYLFNSPATPTIVWLIGILTSVVVISAAAYIARVAYLNAMQTTGEDKTNNILLMSYILSIVPDLSVILAVMFVFCAWGLLALYNIVISTSWLPAILFLLAVVTYYIYRE